MEGKARRHHCQRTLRIVEFLSPIHGNNTKSLYILTESLVSHKISFKHLKLNRESTMKLIVTFTVVSSLLLANHIYPSTITFTTTDNFKKRVEIQELEIKRLKEQSDKLDSQIAKVLNDMYFPESSETIDTQLIKDIFKNLFKYDIEKYEPSLKIPLANFMYGSDPSDEALLEKSKVSYAAILKYQYEVENTWYRNSPLGNDRARYQDLEHDQIIPFSIESSLRVFFQASTYNHLFHKKEFISREVTAKNSFLKNGLIATLDNDKPHQEMSQKRPVTILMQEHALCSYILTKKSQQLDEEIAKEHGKQSPSDGWKAYKKEETVSLRALLHKKEEFPTLHGKITIQNYTPANALLAYLPQNIHSILNTSCALHKIDFPTCKEIKAFIYGSLPIRINLICEINAKKEFLKKPLLPA